jgi:signal transduction histidine kinase
MNLGTTVIDPASDLSEITFLVHDLRSPLCAIRGGAEALLNARLSELQADRIARAMYSASVRMVELLDEVLARYKGLARDAETCKLHEIVASAANEIALVAESQGVRISQNVPGGLLITAGRWRIHRVLINLFVNALHVMPNGGVIYISAVPENHTVLIRVRDTGSGIAPEIRDRLFQPFTTGGKAGGLGLGLFFSRQAVVFHGGEMWVDSGGQGTCIAFRLPILNTEMPLTNGPCSKTRNRGGHAGQADAPCSKSLCTGGALSSDSRSGSSGSKESAIFTISS